MTTPLRVLLVDDTEVDRMAVLRAVKKAGVVVAWTEATDVSGAVALLRDRQFDCAIVDYMLPDGDASEVVAEAVNLGERGPPVIVLTGHGSESLAVELLKAGALDYLPKSELTPSRIGQSIRNVLRVHRAECEAERFAGELQRANVELERRVVERTAELTTANSQLLLHRESLRALASQLSVAEERERQRIAGVLHDQIGPTLASLKLRLQQEGARHQLGDCVRECTGMIDEVIERTRSLTYDVGSPILYQLGLEPALENLAERYRKQHGVEVVVVCDDSEEPLTDDLRGVLFNSVRECLFNVQKHARATRVRIVVERKGPSVSLRVEDDGAGFDPTRLQLTNGVRQGYGLFSIQERLQHLGGTMRVESTPGGGTSVQLQVDVQDASGAARAGEIRSDGRAD